MKSWASVQVLLDGSWFIESLCFSEKGNTSPSVWVGPVISFNKFHFLSTNSKKKGVTFPSYGQNDQKTTSSSCSTLALGPRSAASVAPVSLTRGSSPLEQRLAQSDGVICKAQSGPSGGVCLANGESASA